MNDAPYRWVCLSCQQTNEAGIESCVACGFPASATGFDLRNWRAGKGLPVPAGKTAQPKTPDVASWLRRLAYWLLIGGLLFIPLSIFLTWQFGTEGSGGPGGWGSGLFILMIGIGGITPTLFFAGLLALFSESFRNGEKGMAPWLAALFTVIELVLLAFFCLELYLLVLFLQE